jgi:hypothetical protein
LTAKKWNWIFAARNDPLAKRGRRLEITAILNRNVQNAPSSRRRASGCSPLSVPDNLRSRPPGSCDFHPSAPRKFKHPNEILIKSLCPPYELSSTIRCEKVDAHRIRRFRNSGSLLTPKPESGSPVLEMPFLVATK